MAVRIPDFVTHLPSWRFVLATVDLSPNIHKTPILLLRLIYLQNLLAALLSKLVFQAALDLVAVLLSILFMFTKH